MIQDVHMKLSLGFPWQKQHSIGRRLFIRKLDINLRKKLVKCYIWIIELYGAEILTLQKVDQKCLESFEMRCWRRMESISWTDHVRSEVLHTAREKRNILHSVKRRKADWLGDILHRNCRLKHVIEGRIEGEIEVTGR